VTFSGEIFFFTLYSTLSTKGRITSASRTPEAVRDNFIDLDQLSNVPVTITSSSSDAVLMGLAREFGISSANHLNTFLTCVISLCSYPVDSRDVLRSPDTDELKCGRVGWGERAYL
jgi:hypothetical protein